MEINELIVKALSNPRGISGECWPSGDPMTNLERYQESQRRSGQF